MTDVCVDNEHCKKCSPISTKYYPFELLALRGEFSQNKFGKPISERDVLCPNCISYVKTPPSWKNAWPAVLYQLLFLSTEREHQNFLFELLPHELLRSRS